jgi:hypothetical protein
MHWLAHLIGWNQCRTYSWTDMNGRFFTGAQCVTCGRVHPDTIVDWRALMERKKLERIGNGAS